MNKTVSKSRTTQRKDMKKPANNNVIYHHIPLKLVIYSITALLLFACNNPKTPDKNCSCEKTITADSVLFATNVRLTTEAGRRVVHFNCATIETAIASVSDAESNNEQCTNLYDLKCVSSQEHRLDLSDDFTYFTTKTIPQHRFFETLENDKNSFFEFTLEKQKIKSVLQLEMGE